MTQITDIVEWRDALAAIAAATSNEGTMVASSKDEVAAARARSSAAVRALRDIGTPAQRLEIVARLIEDPAIKKADLAYVVFGQENKIWHLRRLLAPSERPCECCGQPVPTTNGNLDGSRICTSCDATRQAETEKERLERETASEAKRQHRVARFAELRTKCGLNDEEFAELIRLAPRDDPDGDPNGCRGWP
jgi:CRISPR/Cas system-associated protein Cas10 (large subunit of type III CRISPR-Cas system)